MCEQNPRLMGFKVGIFPISPIEPHHEKAYFLHIWENKGAGQQLLCGNRTAGPGGNPRRQVFS